MAEFIGAKPRWDSPAFATRTVEEPSWLDMILFYEALTELPLARFVECR